MGLEPTTSSLGTRPVYGPTTLNSTVLEWLTSNTPPWGNGESGSENGFGGPGVDPGRRPPLNCGDVSHRTPGRTVPPLLILT